MYLVTVIPIARGIGREELSYVSRYNAEPGSILSVPVRRRSVPAIVTESIPAADAKTRIRQAAYTLKKTAADTEPVQFLAPDMLDAIRRIAHEHAGTTGATLHALTAKAIIDAPEIHAGAQTKRNRSGGTAVEKLILQSPYAQRLETYRNLIRESFARNESVFILAPTTKDVSALHAYLQKGIEAYVFALHGSLSKKQQSTVWNAARTDTHPVLVITTGTFLTLPRNDFATYIIERDQSRFYKTAARPYIDMRIAAEYIAEAARARCVFADMPVRVATYYRYETGALEELAPPQQVLQQNPPITIHDTRVKTDSGEKPFRIIGDTLAGAIRHAVANAQRVFIYAPRRGIAPVTVCQDCGQTVLCDTCGASAVLHRGRPRNVFRCHVCGTDRSAHECCRNCGSWKLKELGVGIQRVADAVAALVPDARIHTLDSDTANTHAHAARIATAFYKYPASILIGTDMALPYLTEPVSVTALASVDALLAIPDFRVAERTLTTIVGLHEHTTDACIVQTRNPDTPLLAALASGRLFDAYRGERDTRRQCMYPPFATLVTIRYGGTAIPSAIEKLQETYPAWCAGTFTVSGVRNTEQCLLLKVPSEKWPDAELLAALAHLPQRIRVDVHPERIF